MYFTDISAFASQLWYSDIKGPDSPLSTPSVHCFSLSLERPIWKLKESGSHFEGDYLLKPRTRPLMWEGPSISGELSASHQKESMFS